MASAGIRTALRDPRLFQTRFRWCQLGAIDSASGLGYDLVVQLMSTMQLWAGDSSLSAHCRCAGHAALTTVPGGGVKAARHLSEQWRVMHYSIFLLALTGRPLRPEFRSEGTRPKLQLQSELHSSGTSRQLPSQSQSQLQPKCTSRTRQWTIVPRTRQWTIVPQVRSAAASCSKSQVTTHSVQSHPYLHDSSL